MKPFTLMLPALAPCQMGAAQTTYKVHTGLQAGYQHNLFRGPANVESADDSTKMIQSVPTAKAFAQLALYKKLNKKSHLLLSGSARFQPFFGREVNLHKIALKSSYQYKFNKKWSAEGLGGFMNKTTLSRGGVVEGAVQQLRYNQMILGTGLRFRPSSKHFIKGKIALGSRRYLSEAGQTDFTFNYQEVETSSFQRLNNKHVVKIAFNAQRRKSTTWVSLPVQAREEDEPIEVNSTGVLRYRTLEFTYKRYLSKTSRLAPFVQLNSRTDLSDGEAGNSEIKGGWAFVLHNEKKGLKEAISYAKRTYTGRLAHLEAENEVAQLQLQYLKMTLSPRVALNKRLDLVGTVGINLRLSNTTDQTTRFRRGYANYLVLVGLNYQLKGKMKKR